jgi:putative DNA methylase
MTRMIERWFPCEEVSDNAGSGWGSSNSEVRLFPWFAKRPLAQARAAVLTSLLDWPDEPAGQRDLQALIRRAMSDHDAVSTDLLAHLDADARVLDPFSGRGLLPLEAVHLSISTFALDNSPVACLASRLLVEHPHRDWSKEPPLPFEGYEENPLDIRLVRDVEAMLGAVDAAVAASLSEVFPTVSGQRSWAYMWTAAMPCQECGIVFPLIASLELRKPAESGSDLGQSLSINVEAAEVDVTVIDGAPRTQPTLVVPPGQSKHDSKGKVAVCPGCGHVHKKEVTNRVTLEHGVDVLLAVCEEDKSFRSVDPADLSGVQLALARLKTLSPTPSGLSAVPDEVIPPQFGWTIQGQAYGATHYRDLSVARQNLLFAETARAIRDLGHELVANGISLAYAKCLVDYACSVMCRRLKFSTRGAHYRVRSRDISDVFGNTESSWSYNFDCLETGLGNGPGAWNSLTTNSLSALRRLFSRRAGTPAEVMHGSAAALPFPDAYFDAVVTDPPYDEMIDYADGSDLYYVWLKRAMDGLNPELLLTADEFGLQDKSEELIVKKGRPAGDHRTREHYDTGLAKAFAEARRVLKPSGVLAIVFGHGDPDVWHRLLSAVKSADLVLTGSWPARTEKKTGGANIETTLTLACRPATEDRRPGRVADVDAEVRSEIRSRLRLWDAAGLALTDQLMASAGPAMEVVGRYSDVLDKTGQPVDLDRYLPLARRFVEEAADIKVDTLPLETFDQRSRFALFWARLYGRGIAAASEARWQRLASDLSDDETAGLLVKDGKGVRLLFASEVRGELGPSSAVIDVALAVAATGKSVSGVAALLVGVARTEDPFVWAAMDELARLVPEADPDGDVWRWVVRNRAAIIGASRNVEAARAREELELDAADRQSSLFGGDD